MISPWVCHGHLYRYPYMYMYSCLSPTTGFLHSIHILYKTYKHKESEEVKPASAGLCCLEFGPAVILALHVSSLVRLIGGCLGPLQLLLDSHHSWLHLHRQQGCFLSPLFSVLSM